MQCWSQTAHIDYHAQLSIFDTDLESKFVRPHVMTLVDQRCKTLPVGLSRCPCGGVG